PDSVIKAGISVRDIAKPLSEVENLADEVISLLEAGIASRNDA
ncbi:hypothetical protein LCGC14_2255960, partial [marine sediment metagenome]